MGVVVRTVAFALGNVRLTGGGFTLPLKAAHELPTAYNRSVEWVGGLYANA